MSEAFREDTLESFFAHKYAGIRFFPNMGKMGTCACGWTVISPVGEEDVLKHVRIHLNEHHPGTKITEDELRNLIKTV